jgi:hypothetical protein
MGPLAAIMRDNRSFCFDYSPSVSYDPASDPEQLTSFRILAKSHAKVCRHRFASRRGNSLGHSLIEQGCDDTSMNNSLQPFPFGVRNPTPLGGAVRINTKLELKAVWIIYTTTKTRPLELHTHGGYACGARRTHYATLPA